MHDLLFETYTTVSAHFVDLQSLRTQLVTKVTTEQMSKRIRHRQARRRKVGRRGEKVRETEN